MLKKIAIHVFIGLVLFLIGMLCANGSDAMFELGYFLSYGGLWYAGISAVIGVCVFFGGVYKKSKPHVEAAVAERTKNRAYDEILRLKNLLDAKIISQEEFDVKTRELKGKMLQ
jgi:hypothetical protein